MGGAAQQQILDRARRLVSLVDAHEAWREACVNLVAAENVMSAAARRLMSSELVHRYGDYTGRDLRARKYLGTRFIVEIEEDLDVLLRELFDVAYVEPRALSGHIAGVATVMAFTQPGDVVLELDSASGGHRIAEKLNATGEDMATIAGIVADVIAGRRSPDDVRPLTRSIAHDHRRVQFSFDGQDLASRDA